MKKKLNFGLLAIGASVLLGTALLTPSSVSAEENEESANSGDSSIVGGTSISLMPVSKVLQISSSSNYEDKITVTNDGEDEIKIEVYAAPYSYVFSESEGIYKLGFNTENNFTQITRWITFDNGSGEWVKKSEFTVAAHSSLDVKYKISTPDNIPAGGQYAVIFAHTLTGVVSANGIKTEASPGMVIYGRSTEGETKVAASISDMKMEYGTIETEGTKKDAFHASAKVKNDGNVDFSAIGKLRVESILGGGNYETPSNAGRVSVIPETELSVSDEWEDSPSFGLYRVTWTVTAGEATETVETIIFVNPLPAIIIAILLLTIIIVWVTIVIRKRKERQSRLAV